MKRGLSLFFLSAALACAQTIDLSSLERIASKAKETNEVDLNANQIHAALMFLPHDEKNNPDLDQGVKKLLEGLQKITIRNYEFEKAGQFQDSDLEPIRAQLGKLKGWGRIVDTKDKEERSEVYMFTEDDKPTGIAVIDVEPRELSVVIVKGSSSLAEIGKLHGMMGLPNIRIGSQLKLPKKSQ